MVDQMRRMMSQYVQRNSIDVERLLSVNGEGAEEETRQPGLGPFVGTKKEGASLREKQVLMRARHQRSFAAMLMGARRDQKVEEMKAASVPKGSFEEKSRKSEVAASIKDLKLPWGVYDSTSFFCACAACISNRETQIKADKWWLAGEKDRALSYTLKPCLRLLPISHNSIARRKYRPRLPKKVDHKAALWKAIDGVAFNEDFGGETAASSPEPGKAAPSRAVLSTRKSIDHDIDGYETIDRAIERTEAQLRRMVGSADWTAEVVVIVTSLTTSRESYQESYRLLRFFEAKGVDHIAVDVNGDIGHDSVDYKLLRKWHNEETLLVDSNKLADKVTLPIVVPQVLIDGVPVGPIDEIMSLEDENDLDYILAQAACPNCLVNRRASAGHCSRCSALFRNLISLKYLTPPEIKLLLTRSEKNAYHIKAPTPYDWEKRRRQLGIRSGNEDASTWFKPDCLAKYGHPSPGFCVDFN
ncbi:hypothetical protein GNI_007380 [Gregarina niphandrodes]|uniref:Uncharacterized protein n=1 Tax=Gregarina niphandrodes TaxID=110365 RepID=A0A023BD31_GRENI|nr:hypothetical protein GNI_007380 [Gregarina niphandrodes]EZG87282.1 hypothetical protein GNI_007380 [Gregarina niphandrodes]|eukprot:XP_011128678.1 hypothetical protein GNI_007380 [Gregarina niphandrodes]